MKLNVQLIFLNVNFERYSVFCDHFFMFRQTIIGVTSYGSGCAHPDYPGVYARVTEVKSWIQSVASDTQDSDCKFQQLSVSCY